MSCICTGKCCEVIVITTATVEVFNGIVAKYVKKGNADYLFIQRNWMPLSTEDAKKLRPVLVEQTDETLGNYPMFSCKQFNNTTRKCMDYKNRTKICRGYPYYDCGDEKKAKVLKLLKRTNPDCGYAKARSEHEKHL